MTIYRPSTYAEEYRLRALSKDINQLTGRTRPELTEFAIDRIVAAVDPKPDDVVVDIGCGNGLLLQKAAARGAPGHHGRLIGILPSEEEAGSLRQHLALAGQHFISVQVGQLGASGVPDGLADVVVSNSTFILLPDRQAAIAALRDIDRIAKPGATVFIGEVPDRDELVDRTYGDSIAAWLAWTYRHRGGKAFIAAGRQVLRAALTREPFIISPKKVLWFDPHDFRDLMQTQRLRVLEFGRHKEIDGEGNVRDSATRWNFFARKEAV
ncbi:MAG: class I SAM-dependent methyltransferase [Betaproteobacteria bacterium]